MLRSRYEGLADALRSRTCDEGVGVFEPCWLEELRKALAERQAYAAGRRSLN